MLSKIMQRFIKISRHRNQSCGAAELWTRLRPRNRNEFDDMFTVFRDDDLLAVYRRLYQGTQLSSCLFDVYLTHVDKTRS